MIHKLCKLILELEKLITHAVKNRNELLYMSCTFNPLRDSLQYQQTFYKMRIVIYLNKAVSNFKNEHNFSRSMTIVINI